MHSLTQSGPTLCDPMDCSPPGSSIHGIYWARMLAWVAIPVSRGIFPTQGSNPHLLCLLHWQAGSLPTREVQELIYLGPKCPQRQNRKINDGAVQGQCTVAHGLSVNQASLGHTMHLCLHTVYDCCVLQLGQMPQKLNYLLFYKNIYNFTKKVGKCMVEHILKHAAAIKKQTQHQLHL